MTLEIVKIIKSNNESIKSIVLNNGDILSEEEAIRLIKEGFISNYKVEQQNGKETIIPFLYMNIPFL